MNKNQENHEAEIKAMEQIWLILEPLSGGAQDRALDWVFARLRSQRREAIETAASLEPETPHG